MKALSHNRFGVRARFVCWSQSWSLWWSRLLAALTIATLAATVGACNNRPAGSSGESAGAAGVAEGAAEATPEEEAPEAVSLSINGDRDGAVYLSGLLIGETPIQDLEAAEGRHVVQLMYDDGARIGKPTHVNLRPGAPTAVFIRYAFVTERPEIRLPTSTPDPAETTEEVAPAVSGDGADDQVGEGENDEVAAADGSAPPADPNEPVDSAAGTEVDTEDGAEAGTEAVTAEGVAEEDAIAADSTSAEEAPEDVAANTPSHIYIESEPSGTLYINGERTEHTTPIELALEPGSYSFQVAHDAQTLSRYVELYLYPDGRRQVTYQGVDMMVVR